MTNKEIKQLFEEKLIKSNGLGPWFPAFINSVENNCCSQEEMNLFTDWLNRLNDEEVYPYIKEDYTILSLVSNQSHKLCTLAITENPWSIEFIKNQQKYYELAVKRDPFTIQKIKNQTVELCILALITDITQRSIISCTNYHCYKYVKIVPNPNHETTLKNLRDKKAILEALK